MPAAARLARRLAVLAAALAVLALVSLATTWAWRGGPEGGLVGLARLLRHGTTTVDDFRHAPFRPLAASGRPAPFARAPSPAAPPAVETAPGRRVPLAQALDETRTLAFLVVREDAIVFERHGEGHRAGEPSQYFSVTKSVLATLAAMAVDDGILRSLDEPLTALVPELAGRGLDGVRLRHLADMDSGLDYEENDNPFGRHVLMNYTAALEPFLLGLGGAAPAGGRFDYKSGDAALLSLALTRALRGRTLAAYAQARLWEPLGMEDGAVWSLDREGGLEKAWCCLAGSARDLAKIGRLYLARGAPGGTRRLDERWVAAALAQPAARDGLRGYRLGWWSARPQAEGIVAIGKDGQYLYVDPARRTIVVRLGRGQGGMGTGRWISLFAAAAAHPW